MKILQIHSKYKKRGGEETVVQEEKEVLEQHGHQVIQYIKDNAQTEHYSTAELIKLGLQQRKNKKIIHELKELISNEKPDVCHVHNVYPMISPGVYQLIKSMNVPVVQTLHNYKMLCTNSLLFRDGEVCELCLNKDLRRSIKYKCYQNSLLATAIQADTIQYHRRKGTWNQWIDKYVCLTPFQRDKMIEGGLPQKKLVVKPNFVKNPSLTVAYEEFFLFAGRLDRSKGLDDLKAVVKEYPQLKFVFIGESDDPHLFERYPNVEYLGPQDRQTVLTFISKCKAVYLKFFRFPEEGQYPN